MAEPAQQSAAMSPTADSNSPHPEAVSPQANQTHDWLALRWTVGVLVLGALFAMSPLWAPLLFAAWGAILALPLHGWWMHRIHRRKGAAGVVTVLLVIAFLAPVVLATLSLSAAAVELVQRLSQSKNGTEALTALASGGGGTGGEALNLRSLNPQQAIDLARRHGASAMGAAKAVFGTATAMIIGAVVFVAGFYELLVNGRRLYDWLLDRSPLSRPHFHRFGSVFVEVGRGLVIGVGLTALLQGGVATVGYLVTGVPQPLVLGMVTVFASLIPSVGSGLVWVPVTIGLALTGRSGAAAVMLGIGVFVSIIDNLLRPMISRYADLRLPGLVVFVAMLGGMLVFGGFGLFLGPLFVRLAVEGLTILKEQRAELGRAN